MMGLSGPVIPRVDKRVNPNTGPFLSPPPAPVPPYDPIPDRRLTLPLRVKTN